MIMQSGSLIACLDATEGQLGGMLFSVGHHPRRWVHPEHRTSTALFEFLFERIKKTKRSLGSSVS